MQKIVDGYRKLSPQAKSSLWYTVTQFLKKGVGFIIVPLYTRILTPAEYGEYSVFYSWYEVLLVFGTLKLYANSYVVGMTKFNDDRPRYTSATLGLGMLCTAVFYSIACIFHVEFTNWLEMSLPMMSLLFLEILFDTPYNLWAQIQQYDYKYKGITWLTSAATLLTPVIGITLVYILPDRVAGAILGKCIPAIAIGMICFVLIFKEHKSLFAAKYWKYALKFNLPLIFYYLAQVLLNQLDRIMIQKMNGEAKVGIYSVANAISYIMSIVTGAINVSFIPYMFQNIKSGNERKIKTLANRVIIAVAVCQLLLIALAPELTLLMASDEYQEGVWLVPTLVGSVYINFIYQMYCNIEFYYEKKFFLMGSSIAVCICNFILNYVFISRFGYLAAGYTTLVSSILCLTAHCICVRLIVKKENADNALDNRFICLAVICFIVISGILMALYRHAVIRYVLVASSIIAVLVNHRRILRFIKKLRNR